MAAKDGRRRGGLSDLELEQELANQPLDRRMVARILPLLRPVRGLVLGAVLLELAVVGATFARPWFVQQALDHGLLDGAGHPGPQYGVLQGALLGLILAWAARFALAGAGQYLAGVAAVRVLNGLRVRVFAHVQSLSAAYFDRTKAGRIISRIDRDVETLEPLIVQGPPELLSALLRFVVSAVLICHLSPTLFLAMLSLLPPLILGSLVFRRLSHRHHARLAEHRARYIGHLVETVVGVRVVQQAAQEGGNQRRYNGLLDAFARTMIRNHVSTGWFAPFTGLLSAMGTALLLAVGAHEVARGRLSLGELAASLFYVQLFLSPLQGAVGSV